MGNEEITLNDFFILKGKVEAIKNILKTYRLDDKEKVTAVQEILSEES